MREINVGVSEMSRVFIGVFVYQYGHLSCRRCFLMATNRYKGFASGMWRCVAELMVPDVSKEPGAEIFTGHDILLMFLHRLPLKMKALRYFETLRTSNPATQRYIPDTWALNYTAE